MESFKKKAVCFLLVAVCFLFCFAGTEKTNKVELTDAEKQFIRAHPVITLGVDPKFIPYEFIDNDGIYKGIAADYIDLICERTGLKMVVARDLTWSEAYEKGVSKELDALPCVSKTPERERYFLFSDPYYEFQRVVFVKNDNREIESFEDLRDGKVAVQINSSHYGYLSEFENIELSPYPTVEEALFALSEGKENAFVGNLATTSYLINANGITNLRFITIKSEEPQSLYFAVRNDWPELVSILNKALASIEESEKIEINNKWIGVQEDIDYSGVIKAVKIAGAVFAIIIGVSFFWIVRLRKEIRKRRETEEELKSAKARAEQADQIKSLFLARMSHEIRTPLNAIMGMSYLIRKTDVTITQSIYLEKLTQAARNMLGIINDILDFSKIEAGKIEIEKISFDLDKVLQRVINIISVKVSEQGIDFEMEKDPDLPVFFFGDPGRIEQILINTINNAVKFTEKGLVLLSVRNVEKTENLYTIEFSVKDTGIGMSEEQRTHLFIPFDQGNSSISRRYGGTGLGLSIVKNLVELMNGEIDVESTEGVGSEFRIRIPLEEDLNKEETEIKKMATDCFAGLRVLALEKSQKVRNILNDCFEVFGIEARLVSTESEALRLLREQPAGGNLSYNILLVDFNTPEAGGIEFLKQVRQDSLLGNTTKSILMLPMTREDLFEQCKAEGIDFAIMKPIIPSVLYNGIIELFGIKPPDAKEVMKGPKTPMAPYPHHILLVEDNKTNQYIAETILEQAGFRVSLADNGEMGVNFYEANKKDIDLILMDIHMPVMDGYTASDRIRETDQRIPIVAMTADAIAGVEETCRSHGIEHYVSKPFEPNEFIETILTVLGDLRVGEKAQPEEQSVPKEEEIPLLDTADGIRRLGGNEELYRMIIKEFMAENQTTGEAMSEAINRGDYIAAAQIAHKIKSSSGNLGAKRFYQLASELQKSLEEGVVREISQKCPAFLALLAELLTTIERYLHE